MTLKGNARKLQLGGDIESLLVDLLLAHQHWYDSDCHADYGCSCGAPRELPAGLLGDPLSGSKKTAAELDSWWRANEEAWWDEGDRGSRWHAEHLASVIASWSVQR